MAAALPGVLNSGYTTADQYRWICTDCFDDFQDQFLWRVAPVNELENASRSADPVTSLPLSIRISAKSS